MNVRDSEQYGLGSELTYNLSSQAGRREEAKEQLMYRTFEARKWSLPMILTMENLSEFEFINQGFMFYQQFRNCNLPFKSGNGNEKSFYLNTNID